MSDSTRKIDLKWVEEQTNAYKKKYGDYKEYADFLLALFREMAKSRDMLAIVQARAKVIASFSEKIVRKSHKYKDPVNQFTDLCGARIITQTQRQVREMCALVEANFLIDWGNSVGVEERLKPAEFGYRSVHYIIQVKEDNELENKYGIKVPRSIIGLKAEVQVRTLLEHAWADLYHLWVYKNEFSIPPKLEREMAGISARLEAADNAFSGVQEELKKYYSSYGAYLDPDLLSLEIEKLEVTLKYDPGNLTLLKQLGRAALSLEDWDKVISVLTPFESKGDPDLMRILGTALCKKYKADPRSKEFLKGQALLLKAGSPPFNNADAMASLAGSWKGIDDEKSDTYYQKAFELDPTDAYPLGNYLLSEIVRDQDLSILGFTRPVIQAAIQRSLACIEVHVNIPWAWYSVGMLNLLLGNPYESFSAYVRAIQLSTAPFMVETSLDSLQRLGTVKAKLTGYDWIENLLLLGLASKFSSDHAEKEIRKLAGGEAEKLSLPCTILVGGSKDNVQEEMERFGPLFKDAFSEYQGTIVSGGTRTGISKLAGDLQETYKDRIYAVGYLPASKTAHADTDKKRYREIRTTDGETFSPLEATRYWMDVMASGIRPGQVKLLVVNGARISSAECELALLLGAKVAIIEGSGGEPVKLLSDSTWEQSTSLMLLPGDSLIISSYISSVRSDMDENIREAVAREIHERYLSSRREELEPKDPSTEPWESLDPGLKHSNFSQADQIFEKLERFGYAVRKAAGKDIKVHDFEKDGDDIIERMAELEHARWVVERLTEGWKYAPRKDVSKKLSPYLVRWELLTEDIKKYDRDTVREIPSYLAKVGLEVYPLKK
jgi:ppGpp synthetase/RelA/SpoT-type nucleotidyltranferase